MSKNLDKLKGHSNVKQDINRRGDGEEINGKHSSKLNKRINDIKKVQNVPYFTPTFYLSICFRDVENISGILSGPN